MRTVLYLSILLSSCSLAKTPLTSTTAAVSGDREEIVFLVLKISKSSTGKENTLELISQSISAGKIKRDPAPARHSGNYLTIEAFERDQLIRTTYLEHPLYKHIEYIDGNNTLASREIELDQAEFFIRFTRRNPVRVRISETLKGQLQKELITINL